MKRKIKELSNQVGKVEQQLKKEVEKLKNFGAECDCEDCEGYNFVHEGNWKEIEELCLNCGGMVNNGEWL